MALSTDPANALPIIQTNAAATAAQVPVAEQNEKEKEKNCPICCKFEEREKVWGDIRGLKRELVAEFVMKMDGLTLVDMGAGDGTVLGSVLSGGSANFNHIVAVEPFPNAFDSGDAKEAETVSRFITLPIKCVDLPPKLAEHKLTDIGLFLCWPDPQQQAYDLEAIRLLKPKKIVLLVGSYTVTQNNRTYASPLAGSADLFNHFLAKMLHSKKKISVVDGTRYRLTRIETVEDPHYFDDIATDDLENPRDAKLMLLYIVQIPTK